VYIDKYIDYRSEKVLANVKRTAARALHVTLYLISRSRHSVEKQLSMHPMVHAHSATRAQLLSLLVSAWCNASPHRAWRHMQCPSACASQGPCSPQVLCTQVGDTHPVTCLWDPQPSPLQRITRCNALSF
jgi:hypothetical protein